MINRTLKSVYILNPPVTSRVAPVTKELFGEQRNRMASATSSGWHTLRRGVCSMQALFGSSGRATIIGVCVSDGNTALQRIPCCANSLATVLVRATTAPLDVVYAVCHQAREPTLAQDAGDVHNDSLRDTGGDHGTCSGSCHQERALGKTAKV